METQKSIKHIKRFHVIVTQKEIDEAQVAKSRHCMIKESIKRDHPEFTGVEVDKNNIRFSDPKANCIYTFQMNPRARVMLLKWDAGEEVRPFDFYVSKPVVRERRYIGKNGKPQARGGGSKANLGAIPHPKTTRERMTTGRDRVFGAKQWTEELARLRELFIGYRTPEEYKAATEGEK